ncbi:MAG: AAA family ATPase [Rikenellaceae bacterium]|nr:AAA family ATPase [Rikenellaceae bacterium]
MLSAHISSQIYRIFAFEPTHGQKKIIEQLSEFISQGDPQTIFMINGYAGTGKTSVLSALVKTLRQFRVKTILMAPTGRAAKVLAVASGAPAFTIHKKIYRQKSLASDRMHFDLNFNSDRDAVYIVDEVSMLSNYGGDSSLFGTGRLLDDLVSYVRSGNHCKLIIVGDSAQLSPVGLDFSPALDPQEMSVYGTPQLYTLDEVMRQGEKSGILFNATLVRCMIEEHIIDIPLFRTDFPDVQSLHGGEFLEEIARAYDRYGMENVMVITRSNKRANQFNEGIRRHILFREEEVSVGDMLMIVKNNYHFTEKNKEIDLDFIANGDIACLERIRRYDEQFGFRFADVVLSFPDYGGLEMECRILLDTLQSQAPCLTAEQSSALWWAVSEDYADISVKSKRYKAIREDSYFNAMQVKFAYAVTCHKAQGGQWDCVFIDRVLFGEEEMTLDRLRWLYTAITRAAKEVCFVNFDEQFFE